MRESDRRRNFFEQDMDLDAALAAAPDDGTRYELLIAHYERQAAFRASPEYAAAVRQISQHREARMRRIHRRRRLRRVAVLAFIGSMGLMIGVQLYNLYF